MSQHVQDRADNALSPLLKKATFSKMTVLAAIVFFGAAVILLTSLYQQQKVSTALTEKSALEATIIALEHRINRYYTLEQPNEVTALREDMRKTYTSLKQYVVNDIDNDFVPKVLPVDEFRQKQRQLSKDSAYHIAQDSVHLLHTILNVSVDDSKILLGTNFTLLPLVNAMQTEERILIDEIAMLRQEMIVLVLVALTIAAILVGISWLFKDFIPHKNASSLHRSHLRLALIDQEKELREKEFLQLISQEFRAPISAIISALELIPNLEDQRERLIRQAEQSSYRLLNLTNNLTEVLTKHSSKDLEMTEVDLISLLDECISPFSVQIKDKKVDFNMHCSHSVPHFIESDPTAIAKVIVNVMDNAVKFTNSGLIDIAMTTEVKNQKVFLAVTISDTGIGIDDKTREKMYNRFYRGAHTGSQRFPGAGIGLSVAKRNLDKLNGAIEVSSTVGVGSEFKIYIPVKPLESLPSAKETATNARFAIVDDLEISRLHLQSIITNEGYSARTFCSGAELINLHDDVLQFTAIIADLYMPGMSGLELVRTLHAIYGERIPPVIVLSATPDIANIVAKSKLPTYQSFVKPIDKQRFVDAIRTIAEHKQKIIESERTANILLVEDEPINAEMVEYMLETMGHIVTTCYTGEDAIQHVGNNQFDCVLLDINLPDISGLEVAKVIRERSPTLPIVALTANAHRSDKVASLAAGMRYHLVKPVTYQELKNTLKLTL
ncbi:hypothetical protein MTsDn1_23350 [Alteromonas sp. MTD1]|uniref:hybrid sensor histidine kinase/response regulator n=1 Tax=Alteromonas sp. MTD1 TaxID=3057962 RepID=UPI0036F37C68